MSTRKRLPRLNKQNGCRRMFELCVKEFYRGQMDRDKFDSIKDGLYKLSKIIDSTLIEERLTRVEKQLKGKGDTA